MEFEGGRFFPTIGLPLGSFDVGPPSSLVAEFPTEIIVGSAGRSMILKTRKEESSYVRKVVSQSSLKMFYFSFSFVDCKYYEVEGEGFHIALSESDY